MLTKLLKEIPEHPLFIITTALFLGLAFSGVAKVISPYTTFALALIFFISALKLDLKELNHYLRHFGKMSAFLVFSLVFLPAVVFYIVSPFDAELAIALTIISAMPAGLTTPILSSILGGRPSLSLIITVFSSLFSVFTIPLVLEFFAKTQVNVEFLDIFIKLVEVIAIPFVLAEIVKHFLPNAIEKSAKNLKIISVVLLGFVIMGIAAGQAERILGSLNTSILPLILAVFVLFGSRHLIGYYFSFWRGKHEKIAVTISLTYVNIALAIYISASFFESSKIITVVVLSELPWVLMLPVFKYFLKLKFTKAFTKVV